MVYDPEVEGGSNRSSTRRLEHGEERTTEEDTQLVGGLGRTSGFQLDRSGCVLLSFTPDLSNSETFEVSEATRPSDSIKRRNGTKLRGSNLFSTITNKGRAATRELPFPHSEFRRRHATPEQNFRKHIEFLIWLGWSNWSVEKIQRMKEIVNARLCDATED